MRHVRVVVLEGSPEEIGLAHGRLLRREIDFLVRQMKYHIFRRVGLVKGAGLYLAARTLSVILSRHTPPSFREELKGLSIGSGATYTDLLMMNTLDDLLNILRRLAPRAPKLGCSSFVLLGERCRNGTMLHGRNLDYHFRGTPLDDHGAVARLLVERSVVFVYRPKDRFGFVSIGWPGLAGVTTAINEKGLSLGNLTSYVRENTPTGTPSSFLYRRLMEEAATLTEAGSLLRSSRRTIGNNLIVSSGRENSALLFEITCKRVFEVAPEGGVLVATNHFLSQELARLQKPYLQPHSVPRWRRLQQLCGREITEPVDGITILGDIGYEGDESSEKPFARIANDGTAISVLFEPAEMKMWLAVAAEPPVSRGEFIPIDVRALLALPQGISTI